MQDQDAHPIPAIEKLKTLLPYLWPKNDRDIRIRVVLAVIFLIFAKLVNIQIPFAFKYVVDGLSLPDSDIITLPLFALIAYAIARLGARAFGELRDMIFARVSKRAGRRLAGRVFNHLFNLSLRYHLGRKTGELSRGIDRGIAAVTFMLGMVLFNVVPTLLEFILVIGILLFNYHWSFAAITFTTIVAYAVFTLVVTRKRVILRRRANTHESDVSNRAVDGLINYETVKSFTAERFEAERLDGALLSYENASTRSSESLAFLNVGQNVIITLGVFLLMYLAARGVVAGTMTVGDLVLVNAFLLQLYQPLHMLGFVYREVRQAMTDLEHIGQLLRLEPEIADQDNANDIKLTAGHIRFQDVTFAYDARRAILNGISFAIEPGQKLAVVGTSGAGKSTIGRLLFRFFDVTGGKITVDGQDVREITQLSLRQSIGIVPQDTVLFNDTIGYNIAYGRPVATQEEIIDAARAAQVHDFVSSLPDGYDTMVGERGLKLSGGEKQRVAIARMFLKNPPIVVLDEATSSLDSATEHAIQTALDRLSDGRTTLVIAHRLSTIVDADRIIILDKGRIVEDGRHEELLAQNGLYADLWTRQSEGHHHEEADPLIPTGTPVPGTPVPGTA